MSDTALLFSTDLPGTFNELEEELKTWNVYGEKNQYMSFHPMHWKEYFYHS
jgi:hypothetical protein